MDFTVIYIIMKQNVPVFFLEVKTYLACDHASLRKEADDQMRDGSLDTSLSTSIIRILGYSHTGLSSSLIPTLSEMEL